MFEIVHADSLEFMGRMKNDCVDAIVTDPPYGLKFMGKEWDRGLPGVPFWEQALRILKPGGYLQACGGPRTYHRLASAIEDSGFEIRDCLQWLFGSGFPKSHNVALGIDKQFGHGNRGRAIPTASTYQATDTDRENKLTANKVGAYEPKTEAAAPWVGWGSALKPAYEPIVMARKPFKGTLADNVLTHGTGALNIDGCRVETDENLGRLCTAQDPSSYSLHNKTEYVDNSTGKGRWPANIALDSEAASMLDAQTGERKSRGKYTRSLNNSLTKSDHGFLGKNATFDRSNKYANETGGASRFFYTAKASKKEREAGLENFTPHTVSDGREVECDNAYQRGKTERRNTHPTVKPIDLMRYLVRLVTPPGGLVLDPFCGSGSTGCAAVLEGFRFVGIEKKSEFVELAKARIAHYEWR